jgi:hypothetical protein
VPFPFTNLAHDVIVPSVNAVDVITDLSRVFATRDWQAMQALYHPDARIFTVTGGPTPLSAGQAIAELERASNDVVYSVKASDPIELDQHAAIVTGRLRWRMPQGGFEEAGHTWLITVRDGLVYRQAVYNDNREAAEAYGRLGVTLGEADSG